MIELIPSSAISVNGLKLIRGFKPLSISAIKIAAKKQLPVISVEAFNSTWQNDRILLSEIAKLYLSDGGVIFKIQINESDDYIEILSPEGFVRYLRQLRAIELATQRNLDLENGYIKETKEFMPHDEDWVLL